MVKKILLAAFYILHAIVVSSQISNGNKIAYNIKDFGAVGDGKQPDTKAINQAIETAANSGGGMVYFPAGNYLSGSIHLKNKARRPPE